MVKIILIILTHCALNSYVDVLSIKGLYTFLISEKIMPNAMLQACLDMTENVRL